MEIRETGNSDKGAGVTICDLMAQLEGRDTNTTSSQTPNLEGKLGKDGKLTPKERKRRLDNNLCLFCGGAGHTARDCTKTGSSASRVKGHAATVEESSSASSDTSPSTSESKN